MESLMYDNKNPNYMKNVHKYHVLKWRQNVFDVYPPPLHLFMLKKSAEGSIANYQKIKQLLYFTTQPKNALKTSKPIVHIHFKMY